MEYWSNGFSEGGRGGLTLRHSITPLRLNDSHEIR